MLVLKMCFLLVIVYLNVVCKANVCTDELSLGRIYTATTEWRRKKVDHRAVCEYDLRKLSLVNGFILVECSSASLKTTKN